MSQQHRRALTSRATTCLVTLGLSASMSACGTMFPQAAPQPPAPPPVPATVTVTQPAEQETSEPAEQGSEGEESAQSTESGSAEDTCTAEDVDATLDPSTAADLGLSEKSSRSVLTVTNTSSNPCTVDGFPAVKFTDENGAPLPTDRRRSMESYSPVVLPPGAGADTYLSWEVQTSPCSDPSGLQVTLPGSNDVVELDWKLGAVCTNGLLDVGPFVEHR